MPKATVSHDTVHVELKSCPGGFVELRQLSYAEMMTRRDIASRMYAEFKNTGSGSNVNLEAEDTVKQYMEVVNVAIMEFEFKNCIQDHNLEDDDGNKIDFGNPMSYRILHPKIGAEIATAIDKLNQEDEENVVPLGRQPTSSLQDGETKPSESLTD
jgi:hypothetical protein